MPSLSRPVGLVLSGGVLLLGVATTAAPAQAQSTPICDAYSGKCTTPPPSIGPTTSAPPTTPPTTSPGNGGTGGSGTGENCTSTSSSSSGTTTSGNGGTGGSGTSTGSSTGTSGNGGTGGSGSGTTGCRPLPHTGSDTALIALVGLGALAGGATLVVAGRRRSPGAAA